MTSDTLKDLRSEIDLIDDALHDLLVRRSAVADRIAAAKNGSGIVVPGREAQVLRRLLARHVGSFPKPVLVRVWRELFSAQVGLHARLSLAVYMPRRGAGYLEVARDQYGSHTPFTTYGSPAQVLRAITNGVDTLGILPLPQEDDARPWWPALAADAPGTPRIVALLPFVANSGLNDTPAAVAVGNLPLEPSGLDIGLVVAETEVSVSRDKLRLQFAKAGLERPIFHANHPVSDRSLQHLIELPGFIARDDERLHRLCNMEGGAVNRAVVVGNYAMPLSADELASK